MTLAEFFWSIGAGFIGGAISYVAHYWLRRHFKKKEDMDITETSKDFIRALVKAEVPVISTTTVSHSDGTRVVVTYDRGKGEVSIPEQVSEVEVAELSAKCYLEPSRKGVA